MNKEQQELLDEVYLAYADSHWTSPSNPNGKLLSEQLFGVIPMEHSKESFINEIKTNSKFSKKWGLKIEERELSLDERFRIAYKNLDLRKELESQSKMLHYPDGHNKAMDEANIPTKLITITYNDTKIESYE
jgi:hypothetical protein